MIEVKASEMLDKIIEKKAFDLKGANKALNAITGKQKLYGAALGAGTGALAGMSGSDDNKAQGALTGALIGGAAGAAGGAVSQAHTAKKMKDAAAVAGTAGAALGAAGAAGIMKGAPAIKDGAGKIFEKIKGTNVNGKTVSDWGSELWNGFKNNPGQTLKDASGKLKDAVSEGKNTVNDIGNAIKNKPGKSVEASVRDDFATAIFEKVANEQYTFADAIAEVLAQDLECYAEEHLPAEEYVEKMASDILGDFFMEKEALMNPQHAEEAIRQARKMREMVQSAERAGEAARKAQQAAGVGNAVKAGVNIGTGAKAIADSRKYGSKVGKGAAIGAGTGLFVNGNPGIGALIGSSIAKRKVLAEQAALRKKIAIGTGAGVGALGLGAAGVAAVKHNQDKRADEIAEEIIKEAKLSKGDIALMGLTGLNIGTLAGGVAKGAHGGPGAATGAALGGLIGTGVLLPGPGALLGAGIGKKFDKNKERDLRLKYGDKYKNSEKHGK